MSGRKNSVALMSAYGRIDQWCGALDFELENGFYSMGYISRRDIANEIRVLTMDSTTPTDEANHEFDFSCAARALDRCKLKYLHQFGSLTMSSETLHEDPATLGPETIDRHRAFASLIEELEAIDWYDQRAKATTDRELKAILEHNRDEEKEHATMVLEWLRRHDPALDANLKTNLFGAGPIRDTPAVEQAATANDPGSLMIGNLRQTGSQS